MAKSEWGKKRTCQSCDVPFYDLNKKSIECPNCGAAFSLTPPSKSRRPTPNKPVSKEEKALFQDDAEKVDTEEILDSDASDIEAIEDNDDDDDDALIEDTSDLGTADDEIKVVKGEDGFNSDD